MGDLQADILDWQRSRHVDVCLSFVIFGYISLLVWLRVLLMSFQKKIRRRGIWKRFHSSSLQKAETKMTSRLYFQISNNTWAFSQFASVSPQISHQPWLRFFSTRCSRTPTSLWLPLVVVVTISWWSRASRRSREEERKAWRSWSLLWRNQRWVKFNNWLVLTETLMHHFLHNGVI